MRTGIQFSGLVFPIWVLYVVIGLVLLVVLCLVLFIRARRVRELAYYREADRLSEEMIRQERLGQQQIIPPEPLVIGAGQPEPFQQPQTQPSPEQPNISFSDKANITPTPVQQQATKLSCPVCGTSVVSTARWCPNCGTPLILADSGLRMIVKQVQPTTPVPPMKKTPEPLLSIEVPLPPVVEQNARDKSVAPPPFVAQQSSIVKEQEKSELDLDVRTGDRAGQQLGNYRLMRLLGYGAFADVYLGEHIYLKKQAAIKVLQKRLSMDALEKFLMEAQTVANFDHPHIVRILEFGVEQNKFGVEQYAEGVNGRIPFLVMEYAPGGTLRNRHLKASILPLSTIIPYVNQVADALQYAHGEKLIHRDVKPENILIGRNDRLLLSDFGVAAIAHTEGSMTTQDMTGTIPYMSPEQFQGKPRPASDQYALAVIVYEWLCGHTPYQGTPFEVAIQHMTVPLPSLRSSAPSVSPAVEAVISKALAKDPLQRFESVQAFARALEQAQ